MHQTKDITRQGNQILFAQDTIRHHLLENHEYGLKSYCQFIAPKPVPDYPILG